jgi:hypothetical protein
MPICNKCNNRFINRVFINGKLRNLSKRKYCLDCIPFELHKTEKIQTDPVICTCLTCKKSFTYKGHGKNKCNSCLSNRQRHDLKKKCIDYKGGRCLICQYDKCARALEFHHVDPSNKTFNISGKHCFRWEKIKNELDKCVLVCSNCHCEIEAGLIDLNSYITDILTLP